MFESWTELNIQIHMIQPDKQKHIGAGYTIALLASVFLNPFFAFALGALTGAAKEIVWDKWMKKGTPEKADFWYTALGALAATLPQII